MLKRYLQTIAMLVVLPALGAGLLLFAGCDDGGGGSGDGDTDGDSDTDSDGDTDTDTDTDTDGDADYGVCKKSCDNPFDCIGDAPNATHDADNYQCNDGGCEFIGCLNTTECQTVYPGMANIVCDTNQNPPTCTLPCSGAGDCAIADSVLYGQDNWACENDLCAWVGCTANSECTELYPDTEMVCAEYLDTPICGPSCSDASDCVDSALSADLWDESHWLCTGGACEHKGCTSSAECQASAYGANSICVL